MANTVSVTALQAFFSEGEWNQVNRVLQRSLGSIREDAAIRRVMQRAFRRPSSQLGRVLVHALTDGEREQLVHLLRADANPSWLASRAEKGARVRMIAQASQIGQDRALANAPLGLGALRAAGLPLIPVAFAHAWAAMFNALYSQIWANTVTWNCGGPSGIISGTVGWWCGDMAFFSQEPALPVMGATQGSAYEFIRIFNNIRYDYLVVGRWTLPNGSPAGHGWPSYGINGSDLPIDPWTQGLGGLMHPAFGVVPAPLAGASLLPGGTTWPRLPYRLRPYVKPNRFVSPSEGFQQGYSVRPATNTGGGSVPPSVRPGVGVHERKGGLTVAEGGGAAVGGAVNGWLAFNKWLNKAVRAADDIYGAYTEFVDMVDAIFYSLPASVRARLYAEAGTNRLSVGQRFMAIFNNYQSINLFQMVANIGSMQAMDMMSGKLSQFIDRLAFGGWQQSYIARRAIRYFVRGMAMQGARLQF